MKQAFRLLILSFAAAHSFIISSNTAGNNVKKRSILFRNVGWSSASAFSGGSSSTLHSSPSGDDDTATDDDDSIASSSTTDTASPSVDVLDTGKYVVATGVQFGVLASVLKGIDKIVAGEFLQSKFLKSTTILPPVLVGLLFIFLSLRSRVASVLDNSRPNRDAMDGKATPLDIKRPAWTPPGIAFPFIWLSITALRGISSAMVYTQTRALACPALLSMVLHLCIGDTWNTITNIEK